MRHVKLN